MLVAVAGVLGLVLGSFANVLIHRVPLGESIVSPPSACPRCGQHIRARHNVPVIGWLWLRGRCADCGAPISARYPLVELATGLVFALVAGVVGVSTELPVLLALAYFSIVLSAIDLDTQRLPDPLVLAFGVAVVASIVLAALASTDGWAAIRAVIGAVALGAFYFVAFLIYPRGMGFGDVKLALVLGATLAWFGWAQLLVGAFAAFLWGAVVGLIAMTIRRQGRGLRIPFGPWMFVGAWTGLVVGAPVASWYLNVAGVS